MSRSERRQRIAQNSRTLRQGFICFCKALSILSFIATCLRTVQPRLERIMPSPTLWWLMKYTSNLLRPSSYRWTNEIWKVELAICLARELMVLSAVRERAVNRTFHNVQRKSLLVPSCYSKLGSLSTKLKVANGWWTLRLNFKFTNHV